MNLTLMTSPIAGTPSPIMTLPESAHKTWTHTHMLKGGMWTAQCTITDAPDKLMRWFYSWPGLQIREQDRGQDTWVGMISELELNLGNFNRKRSIADMWNKVAIEYEDTNGETQTTAYASLQDSINVYGTKETIETDTGEKVNSATAEQRRDDYLERHGWPFVSVEQQIQGSNTLVLRCIGYVYTLNWYFAPSGSGTGNLSDRVDTVATNGDYISTVYIRDANTSTVEKSLEDDMRGWDLIKDLLETGDGTNQFRFYVNNRTGYYEAIDTNPLYYVRDGNFYQTPAGTNPISIWQLRPGVYRDMDYPIRYRLTDGFLTDPRDVLVRNVTVSESRTSLGITTLNPKAVVKGSPTPPSPPPKTPSPPPPQPPADPPDWDALEERQYQIHLPDPPDEDVPEPPGIAL